MHDCNDCNIIDIIRSSQTARKMGGNMTFQFLKAKQIAPAETGEI